MTKVNKINHQLIKRIRLYLEIWPSIPNHILYRCQLVVLIVTVIRGVRGIKNREMKMKVLKLLNGYKQVLRKFYIRCGWLER